MARRQPLVCQYIERLSRRALEQYHEIIRDTVGRRHGVYALYRGAKLHYVGLASNLRNRLRAHLRDKHRDSWDRFSVYLTIEPRHMRELESLVIRIVRPAGNKQEGRFVRSENLRSTLRRRLRAQQKAEWLDLIGRPRRAQAAVATKRTARSAPAILPLARYIHRPGALRLVYKGTTHKARVQRDGTIRLRKAPYTTPSRAATTIIGRPANGWYWWEYERAPGQWVRLLELRKR